MRTCALGLALLLAGCGIVPGVQTEEQRLTAEIAGHKWWKVKPTAALVREWAQKCSGMKAKAAFYADKEGRTAVNPQVISNPYMANPKEITDPFVCVYADPGMPGHMTPVEALRDLKAALDKADYAP